MASHLLSKSSFIKGLQCEKHLYLYKYHYDEMDELSEMQKSIFKRGTNVGELAQQLFPGGTIAAKGDPPKYDAALKRTKELINGDAQIIYEAAFMFNEVLSIADILVMEKGGAKVYEVKSSTSISETYINDAALQYYVISNLGIRVKDFSIIYINNQYVRKGELDLEEFFTTESVLEMILPLQKLVKENVERFKKVILKKKMPEFEIGEHCYNPYTCGFFNYCRKHIPEDSIFDFSGMHLTKKYELYRNGIININDVPEDYSLNKNNRLQLEVHKKGKPLIDKKAIKNFLSDLTYPLYFMDFETFQPAVPLFDNSKPYQQIPFQYAVFLKKNKSSDAEHFEFLAEQGEDPRKKFIESLLKVTKGKGDVLVYNKTFEITRLNEIARDYPSFTDKIEKLISRIKDLMIPFQKKYYYAPEMKGSYSIKAVLPALVPELSYDDLEINEGGLASVAYESLQTETDLMFIAEIKQQLLEYCKLDTLGMVRILEKIEALIDK
ncbi:MAG TPA: DUF2779 domain-containing protein [Ignavibacteriaceae bacterium]|nr:DUF2779 domain-containing protein [Ignavibacteriaceae bacterium]